MKSETKLISLGPDSQNQQIVIVTNKSLLTLSIVNLHRIYSIVGSDGKIVTSAHRWLSYLSRHVGLSISKSSLEIYGKTLTYLVRWIEQHKHFKGKDIDDCIASIDRFHVIEWIQYMKSSGAKSAKTLRLRESVLKQFLDWLTTIDGGLIRSIEDSPWGPNNTLKYIVKTPQPESPKYITAEIIIQVLNSFHNECERCMFHTQYDTGLRIQEIVDLRIKDLPKIEDFQTQFEYLPLNIQGVKGQAGNKKARITLISRAVLNRIKAYHNTLSYKLASDWYINDPNKPVFLTSNQIQWGLRNASKQFKTAVRRADVSESFSTHWLRHGTAFSVLQSDIGKDYQDRMLTVQAMLGHSHINTTQIYTQISPALLAKLTQNGAENDRLKEAELIRSSTYLPPLKNIEKRGHRVS